MCEYSIDYVCSGNEYRACNTLARQTISKENLMLCDMNNVYGYINLL